MSPRPVSRRRFLKSGTAAALATGAVAKPTAVKAQQPGKNEKIRIGFIGPGGRGFEAHVGRLSILQQEGQPIELVAVCDVFSEYRDRAVNHIKEHCGNVPTTYVDYREMIEKEDLDAVCIGTPDHWHAKQAIDAMNAGLDVYCEKPMTKTVAEAIEVVKVWRKTGRVMQVGVQSTSLPVWGAINKMLASGGIGKVLQYQTEYYRNSWMGQWRYYELTKSMTPKNINWDLWLGHEEGLAEKAPFDREVFAQWRRFWPFGSGMFTDLFVHRTTSMLKATGLRFPGRVVGAGGIFMEYDGRDVPDVATVVADFPEGVQGLVTATMCCGNTPIKQLIRGHNGSIVLGTGEEFSQFEFVPERPQVTGDSSLKQKVIKSGDVEDSTYAHFKNWVEAMVAGDPNMCNNATDLGAAALITVILGAESYRQGKVFQFDAETMTVSDGDSSWSESWEEKSHQRQSPLHIPGWTAGDKGSTQKSPDYMQLAGPWINGIDPAAKQEPATVGQ